MAALDKKLKVQPTFIPIAPTWKNAWSEPYRDYLIYLQARLTQVVEARKVDWRERMIERAREL